MSLLQIVVIRGKIKMSDLITVKQKSAFGSETTQIATQNNYYGLTPQQACQMAMELFYDNFPKLQEEAKALVEKRVTALMDEIAVQLCKKNITDMSPLAEPDVQYTIYEAQKSYARFATNESLSTLSSLVAERIKQNDSGICLKVAIDKAISIVGMLSPSQLDYLSLLFMVTRVKFPDIKTINDLKARFEYLSTVFCSATNSNWEHLNMLGCLQLDLPNVYDISASTYMLDASEIEKTCPTLIKKLNGDCSASPVGVVIAISNAEHKTTYRFNPKIWINN